MLQGMNQSVYVKPSYPMISSLEGKLSAFSIELDTAERLIAMGYTSSATASNLKEHVEYCKKEIIVLTRKIEAINRKKGKSK